MKPLFKVLLFASFITLIVGCGVGDELQSPADLTINSIDFKETYRNEVLNLPNGSYIPDNPNFDINNSATWTGNMAQYVNHNYLYSVSYSIKNIGHNTAYDAEIDLHYLYDNGDEYVETIFIGDIIPDKVISASSGGGCTNKQLIECTAEVFWLD